MRFVHLGDTHLGCSNFRLIERRQDFYNAFKQVIDFCIEKKPDFVIHTGDLFDSGKPDNETIIFTIDELKRLKKEGIPLLIIPGSHDISVDGTFLTILERVGLLINLANPRYYEGNGEEIIINGEVINDAFICGLPGRRAYIKDMYARVKVNNPKDKFSIFLFHHIISDVMGTEIFSDIPKSILPKKMDYYAGGHWHEKEELKVNDSPLIYSGSTEYNNIDSMKRGGYRGFIYYDKKPRFIRIKTREVRVLKINCDELTPEQVIIKCLNHITKSDKGLIILNLVGKLGRGSKGEINKESIRNAYKEAGWLYCEVRTNNLNNLSKSVVAGAKKTLEEIEYEYLKKQGYNESEIIKAKSFIDLLGESLSKSELSKAVREVLKLL